MIEISHAERVVFPEIGKTKGDVVAYYERVAERMLPHLRGRPLSLLRHPKGLGERGFFQKNAPAHYPASIARFAVPRSPGASKRHRDPEARERTETSYPVLSLPEHVPYVANQGAIELHVPTARIEDDWKPDRLVLDLDPPPGELALVRGAARVCRDAFGEHGLEPALLATGSKGYHLVARIAPADVWSTGRALQQLATLLVAAHPNDLTLELVIAKRGKRVYLDWMRNHPLATVVAPYSLRARPRATVAAPIEWDELDALPPDAFGIDDVERLLERPDEIASLAPVSADPFIASVGRAFETSGLSLHHVDRFGRPR